MNADGSEQKQLTTNPEYDAEPIWSPDGSKILFVSGREGSFDVFVMNADGSGQTNVTNTRGDNETPIGWVPDGSRIIYSRLSEKVAELYQIWVSNADGSDPRQVTTFTEKTTRQTYSAATGKFCFASKKNGNSEIYISEAPNLSGN
jgi:TolB protein